MPSSTRNYAECNCLAGARGLIMHLNRCRKFNLSPRSCILLSLFSYKMLTFWPTLTGPVTIIMLALFMFSDPSDRLQQINHSNSLMNLWKQSKWQYSLKNGAFQVEIHIYSHLLIYCHFVHCIERWGKNYSLSFILVHWSTPSRN